MIVFVDMRIEFVPGEVTRAFGFYDTVPDQIASVNGESAFYSREELREAFESPEAAASFLRLVPKSWPE